MKAQKPSIRPLRQRMIEDMRMRKLGDRTQEGYLYARYCSPTSTSIIVPPTV